MSEKRAGADDMPDPLHERLEVLEEEIKDRVHAVCEHPAPKDLDTGELIRYEENLSIATAAAKEAVTLRRRLRADAAPEAGDRPTPRDADEGAAG